MAGGGASKNVIIQMTTIMKCSPVTTHGIVCGVHR
jgi:hypothetical protein